MLAIYKKELKSYFNSMTGYLFIAFFLAIVGLYFVIYNMMYSYANFEYVLDSITFVFVILIPIITMRIMAEERKQRTDQLLFTSPISMEKIVIGKFLATITIFLISIIVIMFYPLILSQFGEIEFKLAYSGIIGFALLGIAYIAIGMFISTLTESQAVSAVVTFIVILITNLMTGIANILPTDNLSTCIIFSIILLIICLIIYLITHNTIFTSSIWFIFQFILVLLYIIKPSFYDGLTVKTFSWFSVVDKYSNFINGILDISSVIYYLSIVFVFLFMTIQALKKRRWS